MESTRLSAAPYPLCVRQRPLLPAVRECACAKSFAKDICRSSESRPPMRDCVSAAAAQGMGSFDETHPLSLHMLGMHGSAYANYAMQARRFAWPRRMDARAHRHGCRRVRRSGTHGTLRGY
jgi:hypothetical protein